MISDKPMNTTSSDARILSNEQRMTVVKISMNLKAIS